MLVGQVTQLKEMTKELGPRRKNLQPHELADWRDLRQAVDRTRRLHAMTVKGIIALEQARLLKANIASMEQVSAVLRHFASSSKQNNLTEVRSRHASLHSRCCL